MKRILISWVAGAVGLMAQGPVPRQAPDLKIIQPMRGHMLILAFISTQCPHCQRASQVFEGLVHEFAGQLQVAEVAFNADANAGAFRKQFGLSFPVSLCTSDAAHDFLGIARGQRLGTPQVVVIDQAGVIRAQSERLGSPILQTHDYLSELLKAMIKRQATR